MESRDNMAAIYQQPTAPGTVLVFCIHHLTGFSQQQNYYVIWLYILWLSALYRNLGLKIVKSLSWRLKEKGWIQTQTCDYSMGQ